MFQIPFNDPYSRTNAMLRTDFFVVENAFIIVKRLSTIFTVFFNRSLNVVANWMRG